jgi:hypothetical protein
MSYLSLVLLLLLLLEWDSGTDQTAHHFYKSGCLLTSLTLLIRPLDVRCPAYELVNHPYSPYPFFGFRDTASQAETYAALMWQLRLSL